MNIKKMTISSLMLATIISGCVEKKNNIDKKPIILTNKGMSALNSVEASRKLARMGEILLGQEGFTLAYEMFEKALEKDQTNPKANFYKAFLNPIMKFKGFTKRIYKMASAKEQIKIKKLEKKLSQKNMPEVFNFLTKMATNKNEFNNYSDIQIFLRTEILEAIKQSVINIENISNDSFNILFNKQKYDPTIGNKNYYHNSYCVTNSDYSYTCTDYSYSYGKSYDGIIKVNLDSKDLKIVKGYFKTLANYLRLSTAYSIKGSQHLNERLKKLESDLKPGQKLTTSQIIHEIKNEKDLFVLTDSNLLNDLKINLEETLNDALDFVALDNQLCQRTLRQNNLIKNICFGKSARKDIETAIDLLSGPDVIILGKDKSNNDVKIMIDITALLETPSADLKNLMPISFNGKGEPENYPDKTFKGLFPNGDILEKLKEVNYTRSNSVFIPNSVESITDYVN